MKMNDELIGMMECWNIGRLGLEDWGNGEYKDELLIVNCELLIVNGICVLRTSFKRLRRKNRKARRLFHSSIIPPFHYSIIPGWYKQNGCLGIPYYRRFVEIPLY
jgi:hypothetical protein